MDAKAYAVGKSQEELLSELLLAKKKQLRRGWFVTLANILLILVLLVLLVILLPRVIGLIDQLQHSLTEVDSLIAEVNGRMSDVDNVIEQVNSLIPEVNGAVGEAEVFISNANQMVSNNTDAVTETVRKLNSVDFDSLNEAIVNLNDAIRPLGEFVRMFR